MSMSMGPVVVTKSISNYKVHEPPSQACGM